MSSIANKYLVSCDEYILYARIYEAMTVYATKVFQSMSTGTCYFIARSEVSNHRM